MRQYKTLKTVAATSAVWIICLSAIAGLEACGGLKVKWWFIDGKQEKALIRRDASGAIAERLTFEQADGYLAMSPSDVEALLNYCEQSP